MVRSGWEREVEILSGKEALSVWLGVDERGRWRYGVGERCGVNNVG